MDRFRTPVRVDPRGGGGDRRQRAQYPRTVGGSPRGRGRLPTTKAGSLRAGWIPAGAGETHRRVQWQRCAGVDPRGGGGDRIRHTVSAPDKGGSPRGRGRLGGRDAGPRRQGWIPAGAGETSFHSGRAARFRVDPRGGGGDIIDRPEMAMMMGGSPRGRGRRLSRQEWSARAGWIPAGAGETTSACAAGPASGVDPRGGGGDHRCAWPAR